MRVWTFAIQRGGSGKTSLATHLAAYATSLRDKKETIAIIDLDPQRSAYSWSEKRGDKTPIVAQSTPEKLGDVVKGAASLGVTLLIIDTPGKIENAALAAMRASDLVIVSVTACMFDHVALQDTVKLLEMAGKQSAGIGVINQVPTKKLQQWVDETSVSIERFGLPVADTYVRHHLDVFLEANNAGQGVTELKARNKEIRESAEDIRNLWAFLNRAKVRPRKVEAIR